MSSGQLSPPTHPEFYAWSDTLDPADYLSAHYTIATRVSGEAAALGMAMEQSVACTHICGGEMPAELAAWTIRVRQVAPDNTPLPDSATLEADVAPYALQTEVYQAGDGAGGCRGWRVELAFPLRLLAGKASQLLNILVGELPRLGYLARFRLDEVALPATFGPGPAFGAAGLLARLGLARGPILCRAMRPAVGLSLDQMATLNHHVLTGGFHLVKDDELQVWPDTAAFRRHVARMVEVRDAARDASGERKLYFANLICDAEELAERWDIVDAAGVDGVLVAPFVQGFGSLAQLARQRRMPLLAHNTAGDLLTRHRGWGIDDSVVWRCWRHLGADCMVTPEWLCSGGAPAAARQRLLGANAAQPGLSSLLPILQGGKRPDGLPHYRAAAGTGDFMLIVASWVDTHASGLRAGAAEFRAAVDRLNSAA